MPILSKKLPRHLSRSLTVSSVGNTLHNNPLLQQNLGKDFILTSTTKAGSTTGEGENGYWVGTTNVFHKKYERAIHPFINKNIIKHFVPDTVPLTGNTAVKVTSICCFIGIYTLVGKQYSDRETTSRHFRRTESYILYLYIYVHTYICKHTHTHTICINAKSTIKTKNQNHMRRMVERSEACLR